jgi:predicted CXXCH cytochrome family protein
MDDIKQAPDTLIECPSCHHEVPAKNMTSVFGRQLCLSCAGAWFDDDDDDE